MGGLKSWIFFNNLIESGQIQISVATCYQSLNSRKGWILRTMTSSILHSTSSAPFATINLVPSGNTALVFVQFGK
jgi:hypothetical protein